MSADTDVAAGLIARWRSQGGATYAPGGIATGRRSAPTSTPYARLIVKKDSQPNQYRGGDGVHSDFRQATFEIFGKGEEAIGVVVAWVKSVFDNKLNDTFTIPNSVLTQCEPVEDNVTQEDEEKSGEDFWKGTVVYRVWTTRSA